MFYHVNIRNAIGFDNTFDLKEYMKVSHALQLQVDFKMKNI